MIQKSEIRKNLEDGLPILIYDFDGREEEVDMMFYAGRISWKSINLLRKDAGGLICYVTSKEYGQKLGLDFMSNIIREKYPYLAKKPSYGDEPAFSIWLNHITTKTGINDVDRAKTISELHSVISLLNEDEKLAKEKLETEFYSPGHVPVLLSRGIRYRRGHTELSISLLEYVNLEKSAVIAEMLDDGLSLSKEKALRYARHNGFLFIEGKEILKEVLI
ncbi:3,4-dihydroxy-2-butanone-4-phosphate synthase [Sulfurisphaera ohwakuensis]|uniref:3,4-dihydroxy-2-butanone 4-phosphate synthase n=1 Tax=Sulfurisphaera ohwakuensis TaxID=69656 RepID=A0A650CEQ9_SULOH|nr:3,4-dihydroxy-2-butanone-4-phosphate synthase [Sulfurisphaera ohwakuensis]MBB5253039.1 3,4-dihydroxy 2-butanone 4-phosphate synthase [Sulfurisphaera ohwakuensis]QGR16037.1 3,4-dihydroxy-2-butanone 4-phosphate synthase [Sulfurisphaera ohwakuensis]